VIDFNGNASLNQKLILHHLALLVGQFKVWEMQVSIDYIIILNTFFLDEGPLAPDFFGLQSLGNASFY
jgi:hypothetical protein